MKVNLPNIMKEAAATCRTPAMSVAFQVANQALLRIAQRAVELDDPSLLEDMATLGYVYEVEDPLP